MIFRSTQTHSEICHVVAEALEDACVSLNTAVLPKTDWSVVKLL